MICFIILHISAVEETQECISSILAMYDKKIKIIIVDNASSDGSGEILREKYKDEYKVSIIRSSVNLGFAKGNNLGYQEARKFDPDYIVVANNDVVFTQVDFVSLVEKSYSQYRFDVLGPDIYSVATGIHQNPQRDNNYSLSELKKMRRTLLIKNIFPIYIIIKRLIMWRNNIIVRQITDYTRVQIGKPLHGSCYVFSRKFIKTHKVCFNPSTFLYFESYILHYLGMKEGLVFLYDPSIRVKHYEDVSTNLLYPKMYQRYKFMNKCMLESCEAFINIINNTTNSIP